MNIAIDVSPLKTGHFLQHRVRGTGFYIENLKKALLRHYPNNQYIFFTRGQKIPEDVDLVHYPYFEPFFLTLPFFYKYKTVLTIHDLIPLVFPSVFPKGIKGSMKWQIQKLRAGKADGIITDSWSSKKDIVKFLGIKPDKINVAYLAAGEEFRQMANGKWQMAIRKKYNLPAEFALYVGDVTWNKNLPRLIEAIKIINVPLVMVGNALVDENYDKNNKWNQDLNLVQNLIREEKNIFTLGLVESKDLVMLYNLAKVFVMPSIYEGFGLPVLEAMQCGCPVVTTREGSIPEVAGEAVFYVNAYDCENIAKGIRAIYENKDLQEKYSTKGLIQAKKFSWKTTAAETMKIYEK